MEAAEIITRRRKWTAEAKAALLAEIEAEGGRVSVVARRHGLSESLLYNWRSAWKAAASVCEPAMEFVPIGVLGRGPDEGPVMLASADHGASAGGHRTSDRVGMIEIALGDGTRVSVDAFVNEKALARVFRALKGAV